MGFKAISPCLATFTLTGNKQLATQEASRAETERNSAQNIALKDILGLHRLSHHYTGFNCCTSEVSDMS
jgi:hypothetical protein